MAYKRSYGGRRPAPVAPGRVARVNRRAGDCRTCGVLVPAGAGQLWMEESGQWSAVHRAAAWMGSPVSGFYAGGCPEATDKLNAGAPWNTDGHVPPEAERIAAVAATYAAAGPAPAVRGRPARRGRCEDAPCCGCCD